MEDLEYLTAEQVGQKLQLHPRTVRRLLTAGQLPGIRVGARQWRVSANTLRDFIEGRLKIVPSETPKPAPAPRIEPQIESKPEPVQVEFPKAETLKSETPQPEVPKAEAPKPETKENEMEKRNKSAIQSLSFQGYQVGEIATHAGGIQRIHVRSRDLSGWVNLNEELWDLAAGRISLGEVSARRRTGR